MLVYRRNHLVTRKKEGKKTMTRTSEKDLSILLNRINKGFNLDLCLIYQGGKGCQLLTDQHRELSRFQSKSEMWETLNTIENVLIHMERNNRKEG